MIVAKYPTKKAMKAAIGKELSFQETSIMVPEYKSNGTMYFVGPSATKRVFYGQVTLVNGLIKSVK